MRRDLLSRFKCSIVFQVNSNPGCPKRMAAHRSGYAGIKRSPADHSVGFRSRHWTPGRPFLMEGLKERLVWLKTRFFQILEHVILGLVVDRYLMMFAALFKEPEPAPAPVLVKIRHLHPKDRRNPRKGKEHDADQGPVSQTLQGIWRNRIQERPGVLNA